MVFIGFTPCHGEVLFEEVESGIKLRFEDYKGYSSTAISDLDVNLDGKTDLVFHFWTSMDGLSGDLIGVPSPNFLKVFIQTESGSFEDRTESVLQEERPSLGGASRHVVKGDFNNDGTKDLAFAINWEDRRLVEDPEHLSAKLAALLSTHDGYEIKFFGTPSWYHSLGVGQDEEGRDFVTGNGFSGGFQAELWRFDSSNELIRVESVGLEVPANAFEFMSYGETKGTNLLLRNANYPDMFGIDAYQLAGNSWVLVDQIARPYESLGSISFLGWNAVDYGQASVVDINGYPSLEGGGSSYAESCSIRLSPEREPIALFKISSAYIPDWGKVESITQDETLILNSLVGFGFEEGVITKDLLRIENEDVSTNTNFFDCADLDADGFDDIVMYPYDRLPLVYINDQEGKFYKLEQSRIPNVSDKKIWYYGDIVAFSSLLRDLTGDGIPDLLFWPANGIPDTDPLNEFGEYVSVKFFKGTQPLTKNSFDSDGDSISDENEIRSGLNPLSSDSDNDGVGDNSDAFPLDATETLDRDGDGIGDNADGFPLDASESVDTDGDGIGNNADLDDDNDGFTDEEELADGTNPLSRFSCRSGCFSFDIDENREAKALTDGLLVIRHLFGFTGDALATGAIAGDAQRAIAGDISSLLSDADSELDIDGNGESKALTDGLLLIRYLFGFTGDALTSGAIGDGATRETSEAIEAYISDRVPVSE